MNPWLMGLIVAFCSLLGPRFAVGADPVYIVKEVGEIYDTAGTIDAKPRVCHSQYSVVSVAESDETMTRYSAKGFVRIKHDTRSSELLTEVLDPNRPRYSTPESGAVGVITYGDVVDRDTGNRNPVPFGKVWINYAAPRFGFELFCTPGLSLSDVRRSAATWRWSWAPH